MKIKISRNRFWLADIDFQKSGAYSPALTLDVFEQKSFNFFVPSLKAFDLGSS